LSIIFASNLTQKTFFHLRPLPAQNPCLLALSFPDRNDDHLLPCPAIGCLLFAFLVGNESDPLLANPEKTIQRADHPRMVWSAAEHDARFGGNDSKMGRDIARKRFLLCKIGSVEKVLILFCLVVARRIHYRMKRQLVFLLFVLIHSLTKNPLTVNP